MNDLESREICGFTYRSQMSHKLVNCCSVPDFILTYSNPYDRGKYKTIFLCKEHKCKAVKQLCQEKIYFLATKLDKPKEDLLKPEKVVYT